MKKLLLTVLIVFSVLVCGNAVYADEPAVPEEAEETSARPVSEPEFIEGSTFSGKTAYDESLLGFAYESDGNGGCVIIGYNGDERSITVPQTIGELTVTAIGDTAFYGSELTSVVLPDTVVGIGRDSFGDSKSLTSVKMPGVVSIGTAAFKGCDMLREAVLSDRLEVIGDSAFEGCIRLKSLTAPASLAEIGVDAFIGCENMILDCSESELAREYAERFSIATSFAQTGTFQTVLCIGIAAVLLAAAAVVRRLKR